MLINVSPTHLFLQEKIQPLKEIHMPYFLAFAPDNMENDEKNNILKDIETEEDIIKIGDTTEYTSFWNPSIKREIVKIYTKRPGIVPEVSDKIFNRGLYTAEHDIPYHERVLTDLASQGTWIFDTSEMKKKLKVAIYDIEITKYGEMRNAPLDLLGYSNLEIVFRSSKNIKNE